MKLNNPDKCKHYWVLKNVLYENEEGCFGTSSAKAKKMSAKQRENSTKIYEYFCFRCWCLKRIDAKTVEKAKKEGYNIITPKHTG